LGIANRIVSLDILPPKSIDDSIHIASAVTKDCDVIVSWNFKHIVNVRTMNGVKVIAAMERTRDLFICVPTALLGGIGYDSL
jgi:hypothetical protein